MCMYVGTVYSVGVWEKEGLQGLQDPESSLAG
jgi:hypothetical protein